MDRRTDWSLQDINRRTVLVAAVLIGIGGILGLAGLSVASAAVIQACRRWFRRVDLAPHELARLKWEQAKAAAGAGAGAWQETEIKTYTPRHDRATI
jgi:Tfp pilus assembly protein PilV